MIELLLKERPQTKPIWMCWDCYFKLCANKPVPGHCSDCETNLLEIEKAFEDYDQQ